MIIKTPLMQHQKDAVEKLSRIKVGALYMEQGTGKTLTSLKLIQPRYNSGKVNHILWLCPNNAVRNIEKEILKHTGSLNDFTVHGIETLSSSIRANVKLRELVADNKVFLVVDESNLVKNHKAKRTERVIWLAEGCKYKFILNGTPVSRDETDLFSQWYLLDWRILGYQSFWSFAANHIEWDENIRGKVRRTLNVDYLSRKIAPYTYQVKKEDCLDLPDKTGYEHSYDMSPIQQEHYAEVADELLFLVDEMQPHTIYRLFAGLQNVIGGFHLTFDHDDGMRKTLLFDDPLDNPRIKLLLDVEEYYEGKKIIFCKFTQEVDDVVEVLNDKYGEGSALPFNGSVNKKARQRNLEMFENESRFLVANKVTAGYSLNLQFCNNIIFYNNDWDFATRSQAEDRVHRIGQNKSVNIIDIVASDSLDERILSNLSRKENLVDDFKQMIGSMKDKKNFKVIKEWLDGKESHNTHYESEVCR